MMGKKAISEIVAAMMLIAIAIAASMIIYFYSSGLLGSLQGAQPQQGQYTNQITLEYYDWTSLDALIVTLRNTGSGLAVFAAFYVSAQPVSLSAGSTCAILSTTSTTTLKPNSSCKAILDTSDLSISSGFAYSLRIVTRDGGVFSYSCIAGQSTGSI
jgi:flagellin-like protein